MQSIVSVSQRDAIPRDEPLLPGVTCNRVVSWVDSFDRRDHSVVAARALARSGAGCHEVVLCLDSPCRAQLAAELSVSGQSPLTPQILGRAQARLAELYSWESPTLVLPGHPPEEIRRYTRNNAVDLLVLGEQALALQREYGDWICGDPPCAVMVLVLRPTGHATPPLQGGRTRTCDESPR